MGGKKRLTNDEAIYVLKNTAWLGWGDKQKETVTEAVRMAVEALKTQLPKEDITSDCISRQEAIRIASGYCHFTNVAKELEKLPSVQPEPCSDAISRQAAIRWVKTECNPYGKPTLDFESGKRVMEHLKTMPSVHPVDKDINVSCKDAISRQAAIDALKPLPTIDGLGLQPLVTVDDAIKVLNDLPSVQPTYTDAEVQKMQDMEQAQLDKAFELGKESAKAEIIHCGECKHKGTKNCVANVWTNVWATILGVTVKDDFYCGLAERRTDGEIIPE